MKKGIAAIILTCCVICGMSVLNFSANAVDDTSVSIKLPAEYDAEIVAKYEALGESEELSDELKYNLLLRAFTVRYGYETLEGKINGNASNKEAIEYICDNLNVLKYFVACSEANGTSALYTNTIDAWCDLYLKYKNDFAGDDGDMYLKLAVSLSSAYAESLDFRFGSVRASLPAERYGEFKYLISNGYFDKVDGWSTKRFAALPIELMRLVVNTKIHDDEIVWLADKSREGDNETPVLNAYKYTDYKFLSDYTYSETAYPKLYDTDDYESYNTKWNLDNIYLHASGGQKPLVAFGTEKHPRFWMLFEMGASHEGIAATYEALNNVYGIPAEVVRQSEHRAAMVYDVNQNGKGVWKIQNDVRGWSGSEAEFTPLRWRAQNTDSYGNDASFVLLMQKALDEHELLEKAAYYKCLADIYTAKGEYSRVAEIYEKLLKVQPYNYDGITGMIETLGKISTTSVDDYIELAEYVAEQYTYYPLPMLDALKSIEKHVKSDATSVFKLETLRIKALIKSASVTDADSIQATAVREVASEYLKSENPPFVFSFDGENAGKISLNDGYDGFDFTWCYTLGGADLLDESKNPDKTGVVTVTSKEAALTESEIASISDTNDICICILGASDNVFTIDIKKGEVPTPSVVYGNDLENRLIGKCDGLEWCEANDGDLSDAIWTDYTLGTLFIGNRKIYARYKARGVYLTSDYTLYDFTNDNDSPKCKYIPVSAMKLDGYSSQESSTDAAVHLIDGNINTRWHNLAVGENNKYWSVEFDKERYISKIDYYPDDKGDGGCFKSGEVYVKADNNNDWIYAGGFADFEESNSVKTISFDTPVLCRKMKIVPTETYGEPKNVFASGKMLNFYEDATYGGKVKWSAYYNGEYLTAESLSEELNVEKIFVAIAKFSTKDGKPSLIECETKELNITSGQNVYRIPCEKKITASDDETIRIFIWDENMKPLTTV